MKKCTVCKETKTLDNYYRMKASKDGHGYRCKDCDDKARRKWQDTNPDRAAYSARNRTLKYCYGIDIPTYNRMLEEQEGGCAICGLKENHTTGQRKMWNFSVDHCHETNKVRGLLCNNCNRGLGMLGDTVEALEKALAYLRKYE